MWTHPPSIKKPDLLKQLRELVPWAQIGGL